MTARIGLSGMAHRLEICFAEYEMTFTMTDPVVKTGARRPQRRRDYLQAEALGKNGGGTDWPAKRRALIYRALIVRSAGVAKHRTAPKSARRATCAGVPGGGLRRA